MNHFIFPLVILMASQLLGADPTPPPTTSKRPNVLFIFTDDQRADTIAALGNPIIKTPHIDRLCRQGLAFNRAYMQGSFNGATCIASRAMLMSGKPLFHARENLLDCETWPAAFGKSGYTTFATGKWHNGVKSLAASFQQARSVFDGGMTNPLHAPLSHLENGQLSPPKVATKHACEVFADEAVQFIKHHGEQPFFCYIAFDGPHDPHIVPRDFALSYPANASLMPKNFMSQHPFDNGEMMVRDELLLPHPRPPAAMQQMIADYWRYVSFLDTQIGRILDAVHDSPDVANTIIVLSSDSGVARGSHGLIGKQNLYELDGIRVPLIIAGPGIPANQTTDAMCYLFDVMPTLGAQCGVTAPSSSEGMDLTKVLRDPTQSARSELVFGYQHIQRAIRTDCWKLIRYPAINRSQLFDLQNDPFELHDLSEEPSFANITNMLMEQLKNSLIAYGDNCPLVSANPAPSAWSPPAKTKRKKSAAP